MKRCISQLNWSWGSLCQPGLGCTITLWITIRVLCRASISKRGLRHSMLQGYGVMLNWALGLLFSGAHCRLSFRKQSFSVILYLTVPTAHLISFPLTLQFSRTLCFQASTKHCWATLNLFITSQVYLKQSDDFTCQTLRMSEEDLTKAEQTHLRIALLYFKDCSFWIHTTLLACQKILAALR